jgi:hypothetical protein
LQDIVKAVGTMLGDASRDFPTVSIWNVAIKTSTKDILSKLKSKHVT